MVGCVHGEYLKLVHEVDNEWIIADNIHGKRGLVPLAFLTLFLKDYHEVSEQFKNQKPKKPAKPPPLATTKHLSNTVSENTQIQMNLLKPTESNSRSNASLSTSSSNSISPISVSPVRATTPKKTMPNKPAIAPKPKLLKKTNESKVRPGKLIISHAMRINH